MKHLLLLSCLYVSAGIYAGGFASFACSHDLAFSDHADLHKLWRSADSEASVTHKKIKTIIILKYVMPAASIAHSNNACRKV